MTSVAMLLACFLVGYTETNEETTLKFIKNGYQANKDLLPAGRLRFFESRAVATNLDDARSGRVIQEVNASGFFVFDKNNQRFERTMDPGHFRDSSHKIDELTVNTPFQCFRGLCDGEMAIIEHSYLGPDNSVTLSPPQIFPVTDFFRSIVIPLDLGISSPTGRQLVTDIDKALAGKLRVLELDVNATVQGNPAIHLSLEMENGTREYWVDIDKGFIPLMIKGTSNSTDDEIYILNEDIRITPSGAWFPHSRIRFTSLSGKPGSVHRVDITESNFDISPSSNDFKLDFAQPTALVDNVHRVIYSKRRTWSLLTLPPPNSPSAKAVPVVDPGFAIEEMPGERGSPNITAYVAAALCLLFVTLSIVKFKMRFRVR